MTFQRAPPDVNGFGVITSTPSCSRSSQVSMPFGLPLRTAKTTTESVTMPSYSSSAQSRVDEAGVDEPRHVGLEREGDDVGGEARTRRRGSARPRRAYDCSNSTPSPSAVFWNAGISSS